MILVILIAIYAVLILGTLGVYILYCIGIYKIAKNRGLAKPWFSFIPIIGLYTIGDIADNINIQKDKKSNWSVWLISVGSICLLAFITIFIMVIKEELSGNIYYPESTKIFMVLIPMVAITTQILGIIIFYICLYKIFVDYVPQSAVVFLVISILASGLPLVLIVFLIRNKPSHSLNQIQQLNVMQL